MGTTVLAIFAPCVVSLFEKKLPETNQVEEDPTDEINAHIEELSKTFWIPRSIQEKKINQTEIM